MPGTGGAMQVGEKNYDLEPEVRVPGFDGDAFQGRAAVVQELSSALTAPLVVAECYPGVAPDVRTMLQEACSPALTVTAEETYLDPTTIDTILRPHVTEDRVRGVMFYGTLADLVDQARLRAAARRCRQTLQAGGRVLLYGFGASIISDAIAAIGPDVPSQLVYCDLARWQIQLRYRAGMPNHFWDNPQEDVLRKFKRGYFIEWRLADKLKAGLLGRIDYLLDTNAPEPRLVRGEAFRAGLQQVVRRPFRLVPYFDPGVWGGQWMKEHFGLDPSRPNYAWSFDGVPEENSIYLRFGGVRVEVPAMDVVLSHPVELLGQKNYSRFGAEFPIRFDLLDTMGGQNLSLQVHPLTEYIKSHYGMAYTQDESYYILDAAPDAAVYLGLREGVDREAMARDLRAAQRGERKFDADRYGNRFPARPHDHFLIPAGTVHCSAANCMVLEISATPYIFTYKLWDWDRLGLDGRPRPVHVEDGLSNIQWDRTTGWVRRNLVNRVQLLRNADGVREERTGLHELEFIESRRYTVTTACTHDASAGVHVLNLVGGTAATVTSPTGAFAPFEVHYAETFIVPSAAGAYTVRPTTPGEKITYVQASVRN